MNRKSNHNSLIRKIIKNEPIDVHIRIFIPFKVIIPAVLILMAATSKIGANISMYILVFMIFIYLIPDDI